MDSVHIILITFVVACAISATTAPILGRLALRLNIVATPGEGHWHGRPTALLGGAAIVSGFIAAVLVFGRMPVERHPRAGWLICGALGMFAVGLVDDIVKLRARPKFYAQMVLLALLVWTGPRLQLSGQSLLDGAITFWWLLTITNGWNLIDGLDGLAAGAGIIASVAIAVIAGLQQDQATMIWALAMTGALTGFLVYNKHPASIFMGDAGALTTGLVVGFLAIEVGRFGDASWPVRLAVPLLLTMVPLMDTMTVTVVRLATGRRVSERGLDHSHHRLARLGLSDAQVVAVLWFLQGMGCLGAVLLILVPADKAVLLTPFMAAGFILIWLFMMDTSFDSGTPGETADFPVTARILLTLAYKRRVVEAGLDAALIAAAYFSSFLILNDCKLEPAMVWTLVANLPIVIALVWPAFVVSGTYRRMWRYMGIEDALRFALTALLATALFAIADKLISLPFSASILVLFCLLIFNFLVGTRNSFRIFNLAFRLIAVSRRRVLLIGASREADEAVRYFDDHPDDRVSVIGLIDNDPLKQGKLVHGLAVLGSTEDLVRIYYHDRFSEIVVTNTALPPEQLRKIEVFSKRFRVPTSSFRVQLEPAVHAGSDGLQVRSVAPRLIVPPGVKLSAAHVAKD